MPLEDHKMERKPATATKDDAHSVRRIKHRLVIGGVELTKFISWSKEELSYSAGSSAEIKAPIFSDEYDYPDSMELGLIPVYDWLAISQQTIPLAVSIHTTIAIGDTIFPEVEEFSGIVDRIVQTPMNGTNSFNLSSYARILVNKRITETIAGTADGNKTAGQAIKDITAVQGKGLKTYIHPTLLKSGKKVGQIFKRQLVKTIMNMTIWDLFQNFAQQDKADLYVKGDTLYYVPKPTVDNKDITELGNVKESYTYTFNKDIKNISVDHSPLFSHDITVTVKSYKQDEQQTYSSTKNLSDVAVKNAALYIENEDNRDKADKNNAIVTGRMKDRKPKPNERAIVRQARIGEKENYTFNFANATQEDCERIALQIMEDISLKEFLVTLEVRARPEFNVRQYIAIRKYPSAPVNQNYAIKSFKTSSDGSSEGYVTSFTLVNHAIQTTGTNLGE